MFPNLLVAQCENLHRPCGVFKIGWGLWLIEDLGVVLRALGGLERVRSCQAVSWPKFVSSDGFEPLLTRVVQHRISFLGLRGARVEDWSNVGPGGRNTSVVGRMAVCLLPCSLPQFWHFSSVMFFHAPGRIGIGLKDQELRLYRAQ